MSCRNTALLMKVTSAGAPFSQICSLAQYCTSTHSGFSLSVRPLSCAFYRSVFYKKWLELLAGSMGEVDILHFKSLSSFSSASWAAYLLDLLADILSLFHIISEELPVPWFWSGCKSKSSQAHSLLKQSLYQTRKWMYPLSL